MLEELSPPAKLGPKKFLILIIEGMFVVKYIVLGLIPITEYNLVFSFLPQYFVDYLHSLLRRVAQLKKYIIHNHYFNLSTLIYC